VIFIFVVPKVAVMGARFINPVPSIHEVNAEKDAFLQEIQGSVSERIGSWRDENPRGNKTESEYNEEFRAYIEELQQDLTGQIDAKNKEIEDNYQAQRRKQQMLALNMSRVSPASALSIGALSLGKTGIHEHDRFLNSIKVYKPVFTKWVNAKMIQSINFESREQPKPVLDDMPQHEFEPMGLGESVSLALPDFVMLMLVIIVLFAGTFVSFLRYDIR
jgi:hypothetical protein